MEKYHYLPTASPLVRICSMVFLPRVQHFILGVIILNAIILGLETSPAIMSGASALLVALDATCLGIFIVVLLMKFVVLRFGFFKSAWNIFDFLIIGVSVLPNSGALSILRALRILRVLRLVTNLPRLRLIIESILLSLPSIGWISCLLGIVFYIFAVLTTMLFGQAFPKWFGSLGSSMYTLFQVMTLESWSMGISRPVMEQFPYAWLLFITFILLSAFIVLNVFIGIIVNAMGEVACAKEAEKGAKHPTAKPDLAAELRLLKEQINKVEKMLEASDRQ